MSKSGTRRRRWTYRFRDSICRQHDEVRCVRVTVAPNGVYHDMAAPRAEIYEVRSWPVPRPGRPRAWNSEVQQRAGLGRAAGQYIDLIYYNSHYIRGTELDNVTYKVQDRTGLCSNVPMCQSLVRGPLPTRQLFPWQEKVRKSRTNKTFWTLGFFGCICAFGLIV